jgi:hypothetical protein
MAKKRTKKIDSTSSRTFHRHATRSRRSDTGLENVRTQGAILPIELLVLGAGADARLEGLRPEDFHLSGGQRLNEKITECWEKLQRCWSIFQDKRGRLDEGDYGTTLTRNEWLLPLFGALDYGRLERNRPAPEVNGKRYAISHRAAEPVAIHLVSFRQRLDSPDTDKRAGARVSPHSLLQEFLNESDAHLYGFVSNGLKFRILRDNASLVRPAYIEFDLETIMETKAFGEFYLFFLLTHQSRVENRFSPVEDEVPAASEEEEESVAPEPIPETDCWLEVWHRTAKETGVRALDLLREEVQKAINKLGAGFLAHPKNTKLHQDLKEGVIGPQDYYRLLLRLVYRLIFLLILEDRDLLFLPSASQEQKDRYTKYYSLSRIRSLARRGRGGRHGDLWKQLRIIFDRLGAGESRLGIPAFGSLFFRRDFIADLNDCEIANIDLLAAVRSLSYTTKNNLLQPINYRNIGTEELGSIYESLLEMHPTIRGHLFRLDFVAGNERKTSGSYYTPPELVDSLLNTALNPVIAAALEGKGTKEEKEKALLALRVCDPACGSGHFLIGAAHRLGKRLAQIRTGDEEPAPDHYQSAVRDVIAHSIYGVDLNPMAVELCKISLWIESTKPGKGLLFLDHRIKCGNSLLGATPELLNEGIPDAAFMPIEGDDKAYCAEFKKKNQSERKGETFFDFDAEESDAASLAALGTGALTLANLPDETAREYDAKETALREYVESTAFQREKLKADLWAASFVWKKAGEFRYPITQNILKGVDTDGPSFLEPWMKKELDRLTETYRFFHWHLEFADVFGTEGDGGFDVVIGNPPWERIKIQEKEWFAQRDPDIAKAPNKAERGRMIQRLKESDPTLFQEFLNDSRQAEGESAYIRLSGKYPLCGRGDVNTYTVFAELNRQLLAPRGRVGCIVPSGIATDDSTKFFFQDMMKGNLLFSLYDFENRKKIFPAVDSRMKFTLLTVTGKGAPVAGGADLSFFNQSVHDLDDPERRFRLSADEIKTLNPNTRNCPIFRNVKDAALTKAVYRRVPILWQEKIPDLMQDERNPWQIRFSRMFDMSNASHLFHTKESQESGGYRLEGNRFVKRGAEGFLPLCEAMMIHRFNHRFGDYRDLPAKSKAARLPAISGRTASEIRLPSVFPRLGVAQHGNRPGPLSQKILDTIYSSSRSGV